MALNFNPFENDNSLKAPAIKKKLTKLKPWESPPVSQPAMVPTTSETAHIETTQIKQSQADAIDLVPAANSQDNIKTILNETSQIEAAQCETIQNEKSQFETSDQKATAPATAQNETTQSKTTRIEQSQSATGDRSSVSPTVTQTETSHIETTQSKQSQFAIATAAPGDSEPIASLYNQCETSQIETARPKVAKQTKKSPQAATDLIAIASTIEEPYLGVPKQRTYAELKKLDGEEFKLLLFVTLQGFNRGPGYELGEGRVRAALPFLALGTGISRATVARAWKRLQEQGYIKLEVADQRNGFIYRVAPVLYQPVWKKEQSQPETAQNKPSPNERASSLKPSTPVVSNRDGNKESNNKLNKSLSQQEICEERFSELFQDHSAKSREREFEKFKNITSQFPNENEIILEVAAAVKSRGVDLRGQPIGSLMAYLELAYTQERSPFLDAKEKAQSRDARARIDQEAKAREEEEFAAAERTFLANLERFKIETPDHEDRVNLVRELCADAVWLKDPESPAALRIAVSKWAQSN